jgi:hypothetical protein
VLSPPSAISGQFRIGCECPRSSKEASGSLPRWYFRVLTGSRGWKNLIGFRRDRRETLPYIYQSIAKAAASQEVANEIATVIRTAVNNAPTDGVLNDCLSTLGVRGASQVAELITQTMSASHKPPY